MLSEPELSADAAIDRIVQTQRAWSRQRPTALTPREALAAIGWEANLVWVACISVREGVALGDADMERLTVAVRRIQRICEEVLR